MSGERITFKPPEPIGEPFRAAGGERSHFPVEGDIASFQPAPPESAEFRPVLVPEPFAPDTAASAPPVFVQPGERGSEAPRQPTSASRTRARNALIIGLVSLFVLPIPLGQIAIVLGVKAMRSGERELGRWAVIAGVTGTVLGIAGIVLWATGALPTLDELMEPPK